MSRHFCLFSYKLIMIEKNSLLERIVLYVYRETERGGEDENSMYTDDRQTDISYR